MSPDDLPPEDLAEAGREVLEDDMTGSFSCSWSRIMAGKGTGADLRFYKAAAQFLDARELDEQLGGEQ